MNTDELDKMLDDIEVSLGLSQMDVKASRTFTSTGLLVLDLMLSGGMVTGAWYTIYGGEQSSKSTLVLNQIARAVGMDIPQLLYFDYEGSFSSDYFLQIARHVGVISPKTSDGDAHNLLFGLKDDNDKWVIPPRIRYYPLSIGERFFDYLARLQRILPDKLYRNKKWWYVYEGDKKGKAQLKGREYDAKLYRTTGKYWVEAENGLPQALVITDSYPAMNPEKYDVDDPSDAMAMQARMFATHIKRVKGRMSSKRITVLGVNQLRLRPAVSFGNPEYEPGGEALKFYCYSSDTLLQTNHGLLTAEEVNDLNITDLALLGERGLEKPTIHKAMGESPLLSVVLSNGQFVKGKPDHRVRAYSKSTSEVKWLSLEDIKGHDDQGDLYLPVKLGTAIFPDDWPSDYQLNDKYSTRGMAEFSALAMRCGIVQDGGEGKFVLNGLNIAGNDLDIAGNFLGWPQSQTDKIKENGLTSFLLQDHDLLDALTKYGVHDEVGIPHSVRKGSPQTQISFLRYLPREYLLPHNEGIRLEYRNDKQSKVAQLMLLNFRLLSERNGRHLTLYGEYATDYVRYIGSSMGNQSLNAECESGRYGELTGIDYASLNYWEVENLGTTQEESKIRPKVVWLPVLSVINQPTEMTYDCNMPETSTVVTNGIISHNSDVRVRMASRSVQGGSGQFEVEPSISGGEDRYRYIHMRAVKNKLTVPNLEGWARIWVNDSDGKAHGYDPVYDTFWFAKEIGILTGTKNRLRIDIPKLKGHKVFKWIDFKRLIVGDKKTIKQVLADHGINKPFLLREELFKMLESGEAMKLFFAHKKSALMGKGKGDDDDEDDD